nr:hypothetical protein [Bradyrhizobium diazoefficiens]
MGTTLGSAEQARKSAKLFEKWWRANGHWERTNGEGSAAGD